ncbi:bifunctional hydroxymethylpyrimidine kinase/phosphomethylpyrimidine kinase [Furfurilactobacillus cerevisiae]|uniref:bifunctional hydroxymethylpyrimidine kinase/phosphomethylpyrimidine kinase n=1 Tax=Furfurilactobacillus rossiae TaxID=231049 RepID=UPI003B980D12
MTVPQVLTIAGSDCDGSAGAQADLLTFFHQQTYGLSIMTSCVAGNSIGIQDSTDLPHDFIVNEFEAIFSDFHVAGAKTGMLSSPDVIEVTRYYLERYQVKNFVLDPVIMTKHGAQLIGDKAVGAIIRKLIPISLCITPNFYEAQVLSGMTIKSEQDYYSAALTIQSEGAKNVLIKGSHDDVDDKGQITDYLLSEDGQLKQYKKALRPTTHINGTGDTLSACIVAEIAKGSSVATAVQTAEDYLLNAVTWDLNIGSKFGPINHWGINIS